MKQKPSLPQILCLSLLLALPGTLPAATLVNDTFDVGTPTAGDDAGDPNDTAWTAVTAATLAVVDDSAGLGSGNALRVNISNAVNLTVAGFSSQTLSSIGQGVSISFDYRLNGGTAGARTPFFGLYNTGGSPTDYTNDKGYSGTFTTNVQLRLQEDNATDGNNILTGVGDVQVGASQTYPAYDGTERRFTLSLTRVADTNADSQDDLQISLSLVDPTGTVSPLSYSFIDTSVATFTYDEFGIRSTSGYFLDNVVVDTISVPEPGTYALVLGGLAALGYLRSRKRMG